MRQTKRHQGLDHDKAHNYVPAAFTDSMNKSDDVWAHSSAVEHLTFNQRVVGSNPAGLTNQIKDLNKILKLARLFLDSLLVKLSDVLLSSPFVAAILHMMPPSSPA